MKISKPLPICWTVKVIGPYLQIKCYINHLHCNKVHVLNHNLLAVKWLVLVGDLLWPLHVAWPLNAWVIFMCQGFGHSTGSPPCLLFTDKVFVVVSKCLHLCANLCESFSSNDYGYLQLDMECAFHIILFLAITTRHVLTNMNISAKQI